MPPLRVHVLALHDSTSFVPVGVVDLLRKSQALASSVPSRQERRPAEVELVSSGPDREVLGAGGIRLSCAATLREVRRSDLVFVPPVDPEIGAHLELNRAVVPWLRRVHTGGATVASACTGAFLLAEAGLLDRRAATTHWAFQQELRSRYPLVRVEPEAIIVDQGRVITAGGATSFLTLALYLVEKLLGAEVARAASRMFLIDVNKSAQGAYAIFGPQKAHGDDQVLKAQEIIERELDRAPSVGDLARRVAMSRRNFVRRFKEATGNSPRDYRQRVRVEGAKRALESSTRSIATVAREAGYEDLVAFRTLFTRYTGLTPSEYRSRYGPRTPPTVLRLASSRGRLLPLPGARRSPAQVRIL